MKKIMRYFNSLCDKINYDLKVVAIDDYMNLNSPEKNSDENQDEEEDEESIDTKMERVSKAMDYLGNNFLLSLISLQLCKILIKLGKNAIKK